MWKNWDGKTGGKPQGEKHLWGNTEFYKIGYVIPLLKYPGGKNGVEKDTGWKESVGKRPKMEGPGSGKTGVEKTVEEMTGGKKTEGGERGKHLALLVKLLKYYFRMYLEALEIISGRKMQLQYIHTRWNNMFMQYTLKKLTINLCYSVVKILRNLMCTYIRCRKKMV